ncbi:adenylate kinase [Clostridium oryzae]|uniref:Adenylate kinase n=1 Tax=Clostridium oryzae TaxID=1450648 RepID=A0A1V4IHC9_9CLOT|nr:adenylate kinase [Clostridium oryzae]OPJ59224.1 adenylate kinase [Clostridium oryzae]
MKIILLGAPGSGKGTQAKLISENFNIPHISTGDIFRFNIIQKTTLGIQAEAFINKGELVPDSITVSMIKDRMNEEDCSNGFILDGFPRNISQAKSLNDILEEKGQRIDKVLFFDVPEYIIIERVVGRKVCKNCGAVFHSKFKPSKAYNKCDLCGGDLIQRKDDNEEIIKNRMEVYISSIQPLLDYYGNGGPLLVVNGYGDIKDIYRSVEKALIPI